MSERALWVDLSTAPDPLFFRPLVRRFAALGHRIWITSRQYGETGAIATSCGLDPEVVGVHGGHSTAAKAWANGRRAILLARRARRRHLDLAVSFNSYAQAVAARMCRIPFVTVADYEYQPANHLAFRLAQRVIVPEGFDRETLWRQGAEPGRTIFLPGLKEHVSLVDFEPDPGFSDQLAAMGISSDQLLVTMRPPATNSLYHRFENEWFYEVLADLARRPGVVVVLLARYSAQAERISALGLDNIVVPDAVIDGLNLIYWSDLVVSAGGSMNREAVVLATPAATVFEGQMAGVDRRLIESGMLTDLRSRSGLDSLVIRKKARDLPILASESAVEQLVAAMLEMAHSGSI